MSGPNPETEGVLLGVARVLGLPDQASLASLRPSGLWKVTQRELLDIARLLGLTKVSRLNKQALLARVWETLERMGAIAPNGGTESMPAPTQAAASTRPRLTPRMATVRGPESVSLKSVPPETPAPPKPEEASEEERSETPPAAAHKFDMGQAPDRDPAGVRALAEAHIPWSYGRDRVTAMPVDADRLYVYWEVTDEAVGRARAGLGPGGPDAWLSLRIYDVTGRLFDGTNAHSYFDNRIERGDRQWFFQVGKPTSHLVVDIGMKSSEGYFTKIARSGRVEFPRREPVPWSEPEWTTVRVTSGEIAGGSHGMPGLAGAGAGAEGVGAAAGAGRWEVFGQDVIGGIRRRMWEGRLAAPGAEFEERTTWEEGGWTELTPEMTYGWSWEGDREVVSWAAGPFSYPVELPSLVRESYAGTARTFRANGRTHVVWGPWQIVIRGVGAHAEQEVLARWEVYRSWTSSGWREVNRSPAELFTGSSELMAGASERWGRAGSELRLLGASERFALGASEIRMLGASERFFLGASEWLVRGASERRLLGASEWRLQGASERLLQGASEWRYLGASEQLLAGASERRLGGASEQLGGASEQLLSGEPDYQHGSAWPLVTSDKRG
jgi:hypothetical protein